MSTPDQEALIQALMQADERGEPEWLFTVLPEAVIWAGASAVFNDPELGYLAGPTLVQAVAQTLPHLVDRGAACALLFAALNPEIDSLLYETAVITVLRHANYWDTTEAKRFAANFTRYYKEYIYDSNSFIAGLALDGLIKLPMYRQDELRLIMAVTTVIDDFPAVPDQVEDPAYLAVKAIKLLGQCYDVKPEELIIKHIEKFTEHGNVAVKSEARYNMGIIKLYQGFWADNSTDFRDAMYYAEEFFRSSVSLEENRSDAELFSLLTQCFGVMATTATLDTVHELVQQVRILLQERRFAFGGATVEPPALLEHKMTELVVAIERWMIQVSSAAYAHNLAIPLGELATVYAEIRGLQSIAGLSGLASQFGRVYIMLPYIRGRFADIQNISNKLINLLTDPLTSENLDPVEREFYKLVLEELGTAPDPKQSAATRLRSLQVAAERYFPAFSRKVDKLLAQEKDFIEVLLDLAVWSVEQRKEEELFAFKESSDAYDIYKELVTELDERLHWNKEELAWQFLLQLLKYLTRYVVTLFQITREEALPTDVNFLFAKEENGGLGKDANERHLEAHLYDHLRFSELYLHPEWRGKIQRQNISDNPGRADLIVRFPGSIVFVIEMKAEPKDSSPENINKLYLSQAQTYAAGTKGVSILMVLDTTSKTPGIPLLNIRDYCYIDSRSVPGAKRPDQVVVFIVPANRYLPSTSRSRRSK